MAKRIVSLLVITALFFGVFASCAKKGTEAPAPIGEKAEPKNGGALKLACVYVDTMNPLVTEHASVADFLSLIYEGLFVVNTDLTAEPVLAESYSVSNNNTVYTINLRDNITFHNGKKLTSEDVTATFDYISLYSSGWKDTMQYIAGYSTDGDNKLVITLNTPKSDFVNNLDFPILPSGLLGDDFLLSNSSFVPVGTGMYKYHSTKAYKNIILKANDSWRGGEDRAYIDEVDVEILSDEETIISAFDAGTIDALTTSWRGFGEMELTSAVFNTFQSEQNRFTFVGINTKAALFDTAEERRDLWQSIDREKITSDIMLGKAMVASSPIRDGVYYDLPLEEDGKKDGTPPAKADTAQSPRECTLLYNKDSKTKNRIAIAIKQQLESKGYVVELDGQPLAIYTDKVLVGDYELYIGEVKCSGSCDLQFMFSSPYGGICNYDDSELRTLVTNLDLAIGQKEKEIAWQSFKKHYQNSAPQIPLYFTDSATFVNKRIKGSLKSNLSNPFYGLDDMFIS